MSVGDVVVFWILALPAVAVFYFTCGLVEEIIRRRRKHEKPADAQLRHSGKGLI
jgi:hypothetical protein